MDNALSAYFFALGKDTPARTWFYLPPVHASIYRALGIRPDDFGATYACAPFRLSKAAERTTVWAAYPCPAFLDHSEDVWFGVETVIEWDPVKDTATIIGDTAPQIVGNLTEEANRLFSSPRQFFQQWAMRRAAFAMQRQEARQKSWHIVPQERDEIPGGLVIGATKDIRWQPSAMPEHIQCVGIDPTIINKAILRAARLPRATGGAA